MNKTYEDMGWELYCVLSMLYQNVGDELVRDGMAKLILAMNSKEVVNEAKEYVNWTGVAEDDWVYKRIMIFQGWWFE